MNTYRFDFREVSHGSIEIEAEHGVEAEEKFMEMSLKDFLVGRSMQVMIANARYGL